MDMNVLLSKIYKHLFVLMPLLLALVMAFRVFYLNDVSRFGDSISHLYRAELLVGQIRSENPFLWGLWDWNWYCGYPFLKTYSPLFYFVAAIPSFALNVPVELSVSALGFASYLLSALVTYFLVYEVSKERLASAIGASVYVTSASIITEITVNGNIPRLLVYPLLPLNLLIIEKLVKSKAFNVKYFVASVLGLSALMLSHVGYAIGFIFYLILILLIMRTFVRRFSPAVFLSIPVALLISLPSLLFLYYYLLGEKSWIGPGLPAELETLSKAFFYLISPSDRGIGPAAFLVTVLSLIFFFNHYYKVLKKRENSASLDARYFPYVISAIVAVVSYFAIYLVSGLPLLNLLFGKAATFPLFFFSPILASYVILKIPTTPWMWISILHKKRVEMTVDTRKVLAFVLILLIMVSIHNMPLYFTLPLKRYEGSYEFVRKSAGTQRKQLLFDAFNGSLSDWTLVNGTWSVENYELISGGVGTEDIVTGKNWSDYIFRIRAKWADGIEGFIGLLFRYSDEKNYYIFYIDNYWYDSSLVKVVNGTRIRLTSTPMGLAQGEWSTYFVEVDGASIKCYASDVLIFNVTDSSSWSGKVGLRTFKTVVNFDDASVYSRVREGLDWFRLWQLPRHSLQGIAPLYAGLPTIDGWFDQAAQGEIYYLIKRIFYEGELANNTDSALRAMRILNIRYIIFDGSDPVYPSEFVKSILDGLKRSALVQVVYEENGVFVFELKETYPIMASTNAFLVNQKDEMSTFYGVISNESFNSSIGVFLSQGNNLSKLSIKPWDNNFDNDGYANVTLHKIEVNDNSMNFNLTVDRNTFVSLPISYFQGLKVEVDGSLVETYKALPAFIALQLQAGTHEISISRFVTPLEGASMAISIAVLVGLIAVVSIDFLRKKTMVNKR